MEKREIGGELVFGLDIGTRNVGGTCRIRMSTSCSSDTLTPLTLADIHRKNGQ